MVFRRRDPRSVSQTITGLLYPRGGWFRAFRYVKHRVRRLPDSPERIARGVGVGVFTTFTPFYGLHFVTSLLLAGLLRGNGIAALLATFFGNPLTYVPIGVISLKTGHFILGTDFVAGSDRSFGGKFLDAWRDLRDNFLAVFTEARADWSGLSVFWQEVFFPYLVGGILPGIICGLAAYWLSMPLVYAYQNRRRRRIRAKFESIKRRIQTNTMRSRPDARAAATVKETGQ